MEVLLLLGLLVCPLVMGAMMVWMMREMRRGAGGGDHSGEEDPR
jgi:hypothetical protein